MDRASIRFVIHLDHYLKGRLKFYPCYILQGAWQKLEKYPSGHDWMTNDACNAFNKEGNKYISSLPWFDEWGRRQLRK